MVRSSICLEGAWELILTTMPARNCTALPLSMTPRVDVDTSGGWGGVIASPLGSAERLIVPIIALRFLIELQVFRCFKRP